MSVLSKNNNDLALQALESITLVKQGLGGYKIQPNLEAACEHPHSQSQNELNHNFDGTNLSDKKWSCHVGSCEASKFSKAELRFSKQKVKIHEVFEGQNFFQGKSIGYKVTSFYQFLLLKEQWALENYTGRKNFILTFSVKSGSSLRNQVLCSGWP